EGSGVDEAAPPLLIVGAGAHGRAVLELADQLGMTVAGFLDDVHPVKSVINGYSVLGTTSLLDDKAFVGKFRSIVAIGNSIARRRFSDRIRAHGSEPAILIHP